MSAGTATTTTVTTSSPSVAYGTSVTLTAAVAASSGSVAPAVGSVDFFDTTANHDLGAGNFVGSAGTTSTWTLATGVKAFHVTTGDTVTATYSPGTGFATSSGTTTQTVTALSITVTAAANTKTYDGTTTAAATPTITGSLVSGDTPAFSETYDSKNVGTGKTLTASGTVSDGNSGANYTVTFVASTAGAINQAGLTITAAANTKTYDGTTIAAAAPTVAGLAAGDTVTGLSETYDTKNAGTGKTLTVAAGYAVSDGNGGGNYTVTTATSTAGVINKAPLTITALPDTKTYDSTTSAATAPTVSGLQGSDTVTALSETYDTKNVGSGKTLTVATGYTVSDGNSGGNYAVTTATSTAGVINKAGLTITAAANTKTYDGNTSAAATPTVAGLQGSSDTVTGLSETYDNKNVGSGKTLTVAAGYVVSDGNSGGNYTVTTAAGTAGVINKAPLTITAAANTKTYDGTATAAAAPAVAGLVAGDTVTGLSETYDNKNAGTGKTLTVAAGYVVSDGNSGGNYTATTAASTAGVINKAPLTITAVPNTKTYDATTSAAATPTVSGLLGSDTVTGLSETYDDKNVGSGKTLTVAAGYVLSDGNTGANYAVTTATGTAGVINKAPLTITAATNTKTYDAATTAGATPTVGGLQGSDTVTGMVEAYADANAGTGKTLQVTGYTVNDNNSGGNYAVSLASNSTGAINKANATISVTGYSVTADGNPHTATGTATGVGGVNLGGGLDLSGTTHTIVGVYTDTWTFTDATGNYNNTSGQVTDIINQPGAAGTTTTLTTSAPSGATYGTQLTFTAIVTASAGTPTGSVDFKDTSPGGQDFGNGTEVGSSGTTATWTLTTGVKAFNYTTGDVVQATYTPVPASAFDASLGMVTQVINKAPLTITAVANAKTYDGTTSAAATPTVAGLVGSDTVTGLSETYDNKKRGNGQDAGGGRLCGQRRQRRRQLHGDHGDQHGGGDQQGGADDYGGGQHQDLRQHDQRGGDAHGGRSAGRRYGDGSERGLRQQERGHGQDADGRGRLHRQRRKQRRQLHADHGGQHGGGDQQSRVDDHGDGQHQDLRRNDQRGGDAHGGRFAGQRHGDGAERDLRQQETRARARR